jgi:pimeloyl-ACP methyl ester carboxylesterase
MTTTETEVTPAGALTGEPQWLALEPDPVYVVLHTPTARARTSGAAVLLPTFGWDDECSYRRRRDWATQLATVGIMTARFDLPGRENSAGSPLAHDRAESWVSATAEVAHWLRECSGCQRLTAIGIGVGGLIAYQAVMAEASIDDLVLWGVRASGRAYVRELRAYAAVTAGGDDADTARADGALGIGGHIMSADTAAALNSIDLTKLTLPSADARRVLLIGRDAHGIDSKLRDHLARSGVELTTRESDEYHCLLSPLDLGLTPSKTVPASVEWIVASASAPAVGSCSDEACPAPAATSAVTLEHDGVLIRERLTSVESSAGTLRGIISEPATGTRSAFCLVTVNSGALRHTGPSRMFVELARRAAASGIPVARFDLPGLGDSDGIAIPTFERTDADDQTSLAVLEAIYDHLEQLEVADSFVAAGFSLGGYLTARVAATDRRVIGALSVNATGLVWTEKQRKRVLKDLLAVAGADALMMEPAPRRLPRPLLVLADRLSQLFRSFDAEVRRRLAHSDFLWRLEHRRELASLELRLDELAQARVRMLLLLSENEQLLRMLERPKPAAKLARCPRIRVERLPGVDHLLRPLWIQEIVIERFVSTLLEFAATEAVGIETPGTAAD